MFVCFGRRCRSPVCNENGSASNMQLNTNPAGPSSNGSVSWRRSQQQQPEAPRSSPSSTQLRQIFQRSSSRASRNTSTPAEEAAAESRLNSPTVTRNTPILYTTNRGLHLRVTQVPSPHSTASGGLTYDFNFCDLERWSSNRTHTVNLEDTFTVAKHSSSQLLTVGGNSTSDTYLSYSNR